MRFSANSDICSLNAVSSSYTTAAPIATTTSRCTTFKSYLLKLAYFYCKLTSTTGCSLFNFNSSIYIAIVARPYYLDDNRCLRVCLSFGDVNYCSASSFATSEELDDNSIFSSISHLALIFNLALFDDYLRSDYYTYNFYYCYYCLNNKTTANFEMETQTS